jgi:TPR repeat protein
MRGREGLPGDPERASDLAYIGAIDRNKECRLVMSLSVSFEVHDKSQFDECGLHANYWWCKAMKPDLGIDDLALAEMLSRLTWGMILLPAFTKHHPQHGLTLQEAYTKAVYLLSSNVPGIQNCEMQYRLGIALYWENLVDHKRVAFHLTNAAKQAHPEALYQLGYIYMLKCGVSKDDELFLDLMRQAKNAGSKSPNRRGFITD